MTNILVDRSSMLSLLGSVDLYWKSQLLVDYTKDLHTCMILDDQLHEEGYLFHEGVIYHHGRIFLSRASKLKEKMLQRADKEFCSSHMYSMKIYNIIMRSFDWEGLKEEIYQNFQEFMSYVELGQQHDSMKGLFQPSLPSFEKGERSMHNSMCMRGIVGEESDHVKKVSFSNFTYYFTMFM